jgi:hypothetical protein
LDGDIAGTADYAASKASSPIGHLGWRTGRAFHAGLFAPTIGANGTDHSHNKSSPRMSAFVMIVDPRALPAIAQAIRGIHCQTDPKMSVDHALSIVKS